MAQFTKQKAWLWWTLLAVAIVVVAGLAGRSQGPIVTIVTAGREDLQASIASNGKIEPISPTVAHAEFPTFVSSVKASEGQAVHRGQIILTLDDASIRSQLSQARASLLSSQTELRIAREGGPPDDVAQLSGDIEKTKIQVENLERTQKSLEQLVSDQAATQDDLAQNRASLAQARTNLATLQEKKEQLARRSSDNAENATLRVQEAKDQVRALEEQVKSATVVATSDGTLYSLPVRAGDYVKVGEVLAEMADLQHVRVRAFVDEPDLGWLALNQMVEVTWDARPGQIWQGHIERLPMQVISRGTRSVGEVLCSVDNQKLVLLPNTNVGVRIRVTDRPDALVIERAAVLYENGQRYVFAFDGQKLRRRNITVGVASSGKYEVLSGLSDGDRVALPGDLALRDNMDVRPAGVR